MRKIVDFLFSKNFFYRCLRTFFLGGLPTAPLLQLLDAGEDDVILDVGCGAGFLAKEIKFKHYYGFDQDAKAIQAARSQQISHAEFEVADVRTLDFKILRPTKAILYGVLHHLNDAEAASLLQTLAASGAQSIVTLDPVYDKFHILNNLLCKLDRGRHVRTEQAMLDLISFSGLSSEAKLIHFANTKIAKYMTLRLI